MFVKILLPIYATLMAAYIVLKLCKVRGVFRGVVKALLSLSFLSVGIYACFGGVFDPWNVVCTVGLLFAALGDFFLLGMKNRVLFHCGIVFFGVANILLSVYSVVSYGAQWWTFLVFEALIFLNILGQFGKWYSFGKSKVYLNSYMVCIALNGTLGFGLMFAATTTPAFLFGLGCFLFFVSDVCLGLYLFMLRSRFVDAANSLLYFSALMMIAFSLTL